MALPAGGASLLGGELMSTSGRMGGAAAHAGDLALFLRRHRREAARPALLSGVAVLHSLSLHVTKWQYLCKLSGFDVGRHRAPLSRKCACMPSRLSHLSPTSKDASHPGT